MRRLILLLLITAILFLLSCRTGSDLRVSEIDPWLNQMAGSIDPTVSISGKWQDSDYNYDETRFNPFGWGKGWGKGDFEQKGRDITGFLGDYVVKGVISGKEAYLVFTYGGSVYYTTRLELKNDFELIGNYYSSNDRQQSAPYPMALKRVKGGPSPVMEGSKSVEFFTLKSPATSKFELAKVNEAIITIKTQHGHGSGFIINSEGYALTNYHVIEGSKTITALLKGGKPIPAELVNVHGEVDLALIKLAGDEYDYLPLGDSTKIKTGIDVYAIGTPVSLGLPNSISKGIISGFRKLKQPEITLVQTDASINPGNSGGPLVNMNGEVLGVTALKINKPGIEGLGFAISIDDAKRYLNLKEKSE
jgi:hypothetical protein